MPNNFTKFCKRLRSALTRFSCFKKKNSSGRINVPPLEAPHLPMCDKDLNEISTVSSQSQAQETENQQQAVIYKRQNDIAFRKGIDVWGDEYLAPWEPRIASNETGSGRNVVSSSLIINDNDDSGAISTTESDHLDVSSDESSMDSLQGSLMFEIDSEEFVAMSDELDYMKSQLLTLQNLLGGSELPEITNAISTTESDQLDVCSGELSMDSLQVSPMIKIDSEEFVAMNDELAYIKSQLLTLQNLLENSELPEITDAISTTKGDNLDDCSKGSAIDSPQGLMIEIDLEEFVAMSDELAYIKSQLLTLQSLLEGSDLPEIHDFLNMDSLLPTNSLIFT